MTSIENLFVKLDMLGKRTCNITGLTTDDTIQTLMDKIADKEGAEGVRLIYGGKPLRPERKLSDYNIHSNATIFASLRLLGGTSTEGTIRSFNESKVLKIGVKLTKENCKNGTSDSCESNKTKRLIFTTCEHKICINCVKDFILDRTIGRRKSEFKCPHCKVAYKIDELFTVLDFTKEEIKEYTEKINKFAFEENGICECPKEECKVLVFKDSSIKGNRVSCPKCSFSDYCFTCKEKWKNSNGNVFCGNNKCPFQAVTFHELLNAGTETITNVKNVPKARMCPNCSSFLTWDGNCKHMTCNNKSCKHGFCMSCLDKWEDCECINCSNVEGGCDLSTICTVKPLQSTMN